GWIGSEGEGRKLIDARAAHAPLAVVFGLVGAARRYGIPLVGARVVVVEVAIGAHKAGTFAAGSPAHVQRSRHGRSCFVAHVPGGVHVAVGHGRRQRHRKQHGRAGRARAHHRGPVLAGTVGDDLAAVGAG
nr:hypothetical protein [Tanacetum cinerariifolium]